MLYTTLWSYNQLLTIEGHLLGNNIIGKFAVKTVSAKCSRTLEFKWKHMTKAAIQFCTNTSPASASMAYFSSICMLVPFILKRLYLTFSLWLLFLSRTLKLPKSNFASNVQHGFEDFLMLSKCISPLGYSWCFCMASSQTRLDMWNRRDTQEIPCKVHMHPLHSNFCWHLWAFLPFFHAYQSPSLTLKNYCFSNIFWKLELRT